MSKGIKKLTNIALHSLCAVVLVLILLILAVALAFSLPRVQTFVAHRAVDWVGEHYGLNLSLEGVAIAGLSNVVVEELYVEDLGGDTLLYTPRLSATIDRNALLRRGELLPSRVRVKGGWLNLYTEENGRTNLDMLVRSVEAQLPPKKEGGAPLTIGDMSVEDVRFTLHNHKVYRPQKSGINYSDMDLHIDRLDVNALTVRGEDVEMDIAHLTATDKSGAAMQGSSIGKMIIASADLLFYDVQFCVGEARMNLPKVELIAESWDDYQKYNSSVNMSIEATNSYLTASSLEQFVPDLGNVGVTVEEFECRFDGLVDDFTVDLEGATVEGAEVSGRVRIEDVMHLAEATITADSVRVQATTEEARQVYTRIVGKPMAREIERWVERFESVDLLFSGRGADNRANLVADVRTDLGRAGVRGVVDFAHKGEVGFDGEVWTRGLNVGRVAEVPQLGKVTLTAELAGRVGKDYVDGSGEIIVDRLAYGGYTFNDISLEGGYENDMARVTLRSQDKNLLCALEAECDLSWLEPQFNVNLSLEGADFAAIGLAPSENRSWLACNLEATAEGSSLDELAGRAMINDLVYISSADTLSTELVNVVVGSNGAEHSVSLYSPLADVEYRSRASYEDVFAYLGGTLTAPLPLNRGADGKERREDAQSADRNGNTAGAASQLYRADDYSTVQVSINSDENFVAAFVPGVNIAADSSLLLEFSPEMGEFALSLDSDYVEWNEWLASRVHVGAEGTAERIGVGVDAQEVLALGTTIPDVVLEAYAEGGGRLGATLLFSDNTSAVSGRVEANGELWYNQRGGVLARASLADSFVMLYDNRWDLSAEDIFYNSESLAIDNFALASGDQRIFLDGEVTRDNKEPLRLELDNIGLAVPFELLLGMQDVEGVVNGRVEITSAMDAPYGEGVLSCDNMSVGGVEVAPLELNVALPQDEGEVQVSLKNSDLGTTLVGATYDLENETYEAALTVRELDLAVFGSLLDGTVANLGGDAVANLQVSGRGANPQIDGSLVLENVDATVSMTGVNYHVGAVRLDFADNVGTLNATQVRDDFGGVATLSGGVDLSDLNDVKFNIQLLPTALAVIDLQADKSLPFYGKVTASGAASLVAEGANIAIDAALNTGGGSVFSLPLSGSSDFAGVDFVQFVDADSAMAPDTTDVVVRKKLQMESRKRRSDAKGNVVIDAQIGVGRDTELRLIIDEATNNVLVANGEADLNVTIDSAEGDLQIRGDYQIAEGVYNFNFQNIIAKQFTINPDSYIRWNGSPLDANIDVDAVYKVKTSLAPLIGTDVSASRGSTPVECIVNLGGSLADIDLSFDINVPTANAEYQSILSSYFSSQEMMATQFVYLLAMGSFYSDGSGSSQGTAQGGGATGTAIGLGLLVDQVSRLVSNDAYKFNVKYKMFDETASTYGVDFETEIIDDRLLLELEANVDTGGYYQSGPNGDGNNQLTGGGALTLLLDKAGNFILKGFSRTIDRFDENQGLQENGVGVYYRRSFDRLSDLWRKKENKKTEIREKSNTFVGPQNGNEDKTGQ